MRGRAGTLESMAAEPGWYDDGTGAQRWWDGTRWTEHYADFGGFGVELRADAAPAPQNPVAPGWYDDGNGRQRWWDGRQWTQQSRFSGEQDSYGGLIVDGRWIHMGDFSQPIGGVGAVVSTVADLGKRPAIANAVRQRTLFTPSGAMTPRQFGRIDRRALALAIESSQMAWITFPPAHDEASARQFANWVNRSAEHYRHG